MRLPRPCRWSLLGELHHKSVGWPACPRTRRMGRPIRSVPPQANAPVHEAGAAASPAPDRQCGREGRTQLTRHHVEQGPEHMLSGERPFVHRRQRLPSRVVCVRHRPTKRQGAAPLAATPPITKLGPNWSTKVLGCAARCEHPGASSRVADTLSASFGSTFSTCPRGPVQALLERLRIVRDGGKAHHQTHRVCTLVCGGAAATFVAVRVVRRLRGG